MVAVPSVPDGVCSLEERLVAVAMREACCHGRHVAAAVASAAIAAARRPAQSTAHGQGHEPEQDGQEAALLARVKAVEAALRAQRLLGGPPTLAEGISLLCQVNAAVNAAKH